MSPFFFLRKRSSIQALFGTAQKQLTTATTTSCRSGGGIIKVESPSIVTNNINNSSSSGGGYWNNSRCNWFSTSSSQTPVLPTHFDDGIYEKVKYWKLETITTTINNEKYVMESSLALKMDDEYPCDVSLYFYCYDVESRTFFMDHEFCVDDDTSLCNTFMTRLKGFITYNSHGQYNDNEFCTDMSGDIKTILNKNGLFTNEEYPQIQLMSRVGMKQILNIKDEILTTKNEWEQDRRDIALDIVAGDSGLGNAINKYEEYGAYEYWEDIEDGWSAEILQEEIMEKYDFTEEEIRERSEELYRKKLGGFP